MGEPKEINGAIMKKSKSEQWVYSRGNTFFLLIIF
jgi:hypothetical protein